MSKKTKQELQLEVRLLKQSKIIEAVATIIKHLATCATIVLIAYMVYRCVDSLAGQTTAADIGIKILGDIKINFLISWSAAIGGVTYGISQKRLRSQTIRRLESRVKTNERQLDQKRTSSKLATNGETRPEDEFGLEKS